MENMVLLENNMDGFFDFLSEFENIRFFKGCLKYRNLKKFRRNKNSSKFILCTQLLDKMINGNSDYISMYAQYSLKKQDDLTFSYNSLEFISSDNTQHSCCISKPNFCHK